jgi:hypothetical protein
MDPDGADDPARHGDRRDAAPASSAPGCTLALGVFVLVFALSQPRAPPRDLEDHFRRWAYVAGFAGGITSTLFGAAAALRDVPVEPAARQRAVPGDLGFATLTSISAAHRARSSSPVSCSIRRSGLSRGDRARGPRRPVGCRISLFRPHLARRLMRVVTLMLDASGVSLIARALG